MRVRRGEGELDEGEEGEWVRVRRGGGGQG